MPKQRSTRGRTTQLRGGRTDTSSARERLTRGISTRSYGSDSSSARGSQGTPLTRDNTPGLIQEVVQSLTQRNSLRHSEQSTMENTADQSTPASDTTPSTSFANNTLTTDDIPGLVQQVHRALSEDHRTLQSIPWPLNQSLTSELYVVVTYIVGYYRIIALCISTNTCVVGLISKHSAVYIIYY